MVSPEDIEKVSKAVLAIQLPKNPKEIQTMIQNIRDLLANFTNFKEDLKLLQDNAKAADKLLEEANAVK